MLVELVGQSGRDPDNVSANPARLVAYCRRCFRINGLEGATNA